MWHNLKEGQQGWDENGKVGEVLGGEGEGRSPARKSEQVSAELSWLVTFECQIIPLSLRIKTLRVFLSFYILDPDRDLCWVWKAFLPRIIIFFPFFPSDTCGEFVGRTNEVAHGEVKIGKKSRRQEDIDYPLR